MAKLTDISGIGPATEAELAEQGIETPEDLIDADLGTLTEALDRDSATVQGWQVEALTLLAKDDTDEAEPTGERRQVSEVVRVIGPVADRVVLDVEGSGSYVVESGIARRLPNNRTRRYFVTERRYEVRAIDAEGLRQFEIGDDYPSRAVGGGWE